MHVRVEVLFGGNNHGLSLGSIGREMVVNEPAVDGVDISLEVRQVRRMRKRLIESSIISIKD